MLSESSKNHLEHLQSQNITVIDQSEVEKINKFYFELGIHELEDINREKL